MADATTETTSTDIEERELDEQLPPLTPKQERFSEEYIVDFNARRALWRAGYRAKNAVTASSMAYELLQKPNIQARIEQLKAERAARTGITADRVLEELAVLGFSSVEHYAVTDYGKLTLMPGAPAAAARAVQSIKRRRKSYPEGVDVTTVEVKLHEKAPALRTILEYVAPKPKKLEVTGAGGGPIQHAAVQLYMPDNRRGRKQTAQSEESEEPTEERSAWLKPH